MDKLVETLVLSIPNLAGLLLMLFWQQRRIDQLLAMVKELTDEIVALKDTVHANGIHPASPTLPP